MQVSEFLTKQEFYLIRKNSDQPKIVVFVATWCGFCRRFIELIRKTDLKYEDKIHLVDTDSEGETLWEEYRISIVPTIVVMKNGEEIFRQDGRSMSGLGKGDLERAVSEASAAE